MMRMLSIGALLASAAWTALPAQTAQTAQTAQPANTDVYVAPITRIGDSIVVGRVVNVSHRAGYDNQPSFTADSRAVLYTVQSAGQTDIWRYDLSSRTLRQLTHTPESEYSAKPMPGGARFSVVRVERDSTQRLWSFANDGSDPRLVLAGLKPVGYYAWIGEHTIAAYVLGTPSTLHLAERDGSTDVVLSREVGRAVETVPPTSKALFTFTQRGYQGRPGIFVFTGRSDTTRFTHQVVRMPAAGETAKPTRVALVDSVVIAQQQPYQLVGLAGDNEYHTWTPDGTLLSASGSVLVRWSGVLGAGSTWIPVADLRRYGVKNISRVAFSPDGQWLAFAAEPATP